MIKRTEIVLANRDAHKLICSMAPAISVTGKARVNRVVNNKSSPIKSIPIPAIFNQDAFSALRKTRLVAYTMMLMVASIYTGV
jgi:hypothetical protein